MAKKLNQEDNRIGLIEIGDNLGLNKPGTTRMSPRPTVLGTDIPDMGMIGYQNYKANIDSPGSGFLDKMRNKMARSKKGGDKDQTF